MTTTPSERVQRLREETEAVRKAAEVVGIPGHTGAGDPDATDKVLDLLSGVIERHRQETFQQGSSTWLACWTCGEEDQWPCPDLAEALAVLDALHPLSDPSEEGK